MVCGVLPWLSSVAQMCVTWIRNPLVHKWWWCEQCTLISNSSAIVSGFLWKQSLVLKENILKSMWAAAFSNFLTDVNLQMGSPGYSLPAAHWKVGGTKRASSSVYCFANVTSNSWNCPVWILGICLAQQLEETIPQFQLSSGQQGTVCQGLLFLCPQFTSFIWKQWGQSLCGTGVLIKNC